MATINKQYSFIWYGICTDTSQTGGGCTSFDLITEAEAAKIDTVWQIDGSGNAQAFVNGATGSQPFDSLECGYAYYIKLKDTETYDCEIPHAQLSSYGENAPAEFRITSDCTTGDGGPSVQASIGLGTCTETINISAEHESVVPGHEDAGSYETCQLEATGATFTPLVNHEISGIRFNLTADGLLSYRIDNTGTVKTTAGTNINITAVAKDGFAFGENPDTLTVRVIGTIVAKPAFNVILGIDETLAEGYTNGAGANDATPTETVITEATEIASVAITINNNNHVEYSLDGTNWSLLSSTATTITNNFTNLQLRTKTGLSADLNSTISFVATGNNGTVLSTETLSYTTTIGSYSISLSSNRTENVEENAEGSTQEFTITHTGLSNIDVALNVSGKYSMSKTSSITGTNETLNFTGGELDSGTIKFYIKLRSKDGTGIESVTITATGTPEIGSATKSDTATLSSNLIPHPTIDSITINTSGLNSTGGNVTASITTSHTENYGAHHWHYTISNDGGDIASSTDIMVNSGSGGYGPATITDTNVIETPGNYTITAWIVNNVGAHEAVSVEKTQTFTIPSVTTSMNLSTSAIDQNIDVSKTIPSNTINITKENITDVSISTPNNWTATLSGDKNTITVTYKGTTTISAVTNVNPETLTVTGTKGKRSGTPGTTITKTVTLNATLYDDAEFVITGNTSVDMSRTYNGAESGDSQIFTLTNKQNVTYTVEESVTGWEVSVSSVNGGAYTSDMNVLGSLSEGDTFKFRHTQKNAGTYSPQKIEFVPMEGVKDGNLGDPSPNNVVITLSATIEKANPTVSSTCGSLPNIEIEVESTSNATTNSETCSFTLENCTVSDTTGTQGIFSYKIESNVFTYWITDASTIVASSAETLNVSLDLTDSANYEFASGQSPISVSMVGEVNGKATSLGVNDDSTIELGDVEQNAVTTGKKITINDADNLASATISVSGGGFKISATDGDYGTDDVTINNPLGKDFYIKLDSSVAVGSANSTVTVSGTKSAVGASNPSDVTINCTANITEPAGGGGGADDCTACRGSAVVFDHSVPTIGLGENAPNDADGITINGGEMNAGTGAISPGSLCINNLGSDSLTKTHNQSAPVFLDDGATMINFQIITTNIVDDGTLVYRASDGSFYGGELNADGSPFTLSKIEDCIEGDGGDGGDGGEAQTACATCDSDKTFDHSVPTIGLGENAPNDADGITINGGEMHTETAALSAGSLCINNLGSDSLTKTHNQSAPVFLDDGKTMINFQIITTNIVDDGSIVYLASDGTCFEGTLNADGSAFTLSKKV